MNKVILFTFLFISALTKAQTITGKITTSKGEALPFASITIKNSDKGTNADEDGKFSFEDIKNKRVTLIASFTGFISSQKQLNISATKKNVINFSLTEHAEILDQVTVTGTRTDRRSTQNPVIVNVINSQTLADVQACNLSEGLKFQTGLRVETDCQTCNYTQLRMNGLAGGYSQILINGRPIFSPSNWVVWFRTNTYEYDRPY